MKKYIYILVATIMFTSCSDFLDREPKDSLFPGIFWETEKDAKLALTACYRGFEGTDILYRDCGSDNAYNFHRHEGWQAIGDGTAMPGDPGSNMFEYVTIRKCNEFLENIDKIKFTDESKKKAFIGEVRFIRAYRYFIMTQFYGDVPLVTKTFATPQEANVPRDPRETIEKFIIEELDEIAKNYLATLDKVEQGRVTKGAAHAFLTRMYLYRGEYQKAIDESKKVVGYSLFPSYEGLFLLANNKNSESILDYQYLKSQMGIDFTPFLPNSAGGWSSVVPLQSLVDNYEMADGLTIEEAKANGTYDDTNPYVNRDPRLRETIIYPGQSWNGEIFRSIIQDDIDHPAKANNSTHSGYNFKKYFSNLDEYSNKSWNDAGKNLMVFRYAEVLLNMAEAKIELNQIDNEMYNAIDLVRVRAKMPKVDRTKYNNQAKLRDLIRRERRSEFAFEGLRRFDVMRWGIGSQVMKGVAYGARQGVIHENQLLPNGDAKLELTGEHFRVEERKFEPHNILLPIPQTSIDKSPALAPNNPGYN